jgi:oxygen-independent coproporphyrinogen-3 oxidase
MHQYHEVLLQEIKQFVQAHTRHTALQTVFLGGGTPSTYPIELLAQLFTALRTYFTFAHDAELTLEVNPGTVTEEKLYAWRECGITRLSIGVQSLNSQALKKLNRHQSVADVLFLLQKAQTLFNTISVDIIIGLPGVTQQDWQELITTLVAWPIQHVSLYFLTVHEDTQLYFGVQQKKVILPCEDATLDLYYWTVEQLKLHRLYQYEVSNFARPGYQSRHNSAYWQRKPYKGFGLGACSFDGKARFQNEKNLMRYLELAQTDIPYCFSEELTDKQAWLEILMLSLRQTRGVSLEWLTQTIQNGAQAQLCELIDILKAEQLMVQQEQHLSLTPRGLAVVNEIILKFSQYY